MYKVTSVQIGRMEILTLNTKPFFIWHIFSASESVRNTKLIGFSELSGSLWASMTDASYAYVSDTFRYVQQIIQRCW